MKSSLLIVVTAIISLTGEAFAQDSKAPEGPWTGTAGINALINTGNSESQTVGGNALLGWKEATNQVQWKTIGAYGRAKVGGVSQTNTENLNTELRYDRFINDAMSVFILGNLGFDRPAGLDLKSGGAIGFAHRLIVGPPHALRYEVGPDYSHEERTDGSSDDIFSGRGFVGYAYAFSEHVSFGEDFEALVNLAESSDTRLNSLTYLKAKMTDIVAFQAGFNARADFEPVPGFDEWDTTTTVGLIFDLI